MWFLVDDGLNDSPEMMRIPARYRLSAQGLWTAIGVWMSKHGETFAPVDVIKKLGGTDLLMGHLANSGLLQFEIRNAVRGLAYTGQRCRVKAPEAVQATRAATAERVRKHRAKAPAENYTGDNQQKPVDVTVLHEPPPERYSHARGLVRGGTESNHPPSKAESLRKSGTALGDDTFDLATSERGLSPPVNVGASRLVSMVIGRGRVNDADRTVLRIKASELLATESEDDVAECLRIWLGKNELGAHGLPLCMAEVYKRRHNGSSTVDDKVQGWLSLGKDSST
jgi:hypothetical protein